MKRDPFLSYLLFIVTAAVVVVGGVGFPSRIVLAQNEIDPQSMEEFLAQQNIPEGIRAMFENEKQSLQSQSAPDKQIAGEGENITNLPPDSSEAASAQDAPIPPKKSTLENAMIDHLQLKDMDIVDVLKLLSQKSGLNIIAGKGVSGKVSIYLTKVKMKEALRIILDSNNLAYHEEDGIIHVMAADEYEKRYGHVFGGKITTRIIHLMYAKAQNIAPVLEQVKSSTGKIITDDKSNTLVLMDTAEKVKMMINLLLEIDVPVEVRVFELNYAQAKDIGEKIAPFLTEGVGSVKYDERSNKLVVTDVADKLDKIQKVVEAFDVKQQQVLIEAKIVQIELSDSDQLGVDWQAIFAGIDDLNVHADFDAVDATATNKGSLSIGTIANNNYNATLEALKEVGKTNVLSSPSITALNNQEAKILVGSTQPYVTTTTTTPASGPTTTAETINFIDVGVKLYVTPTIHKDGFITMKIRPEVSSVLDSLETSGGNNIPIVKTSEAETTVRIKDGITVVIGGLIEDSGSDTRKKVPFLGDIPVLGAAFRNHDKSIGKTEIAIFLTPRIVSGDKTAEADFTSLEEVKKALH